MKDQMGFFLGIAFCPALKLIQNNGIFCRF